MNVPQVKLNPDTRSPIPVLTGPDVGRLIVEGHHHRGWSVNIRLDEVVDWDHVAMELMMLCLAADAGSPSAFSWRS